MDAIRHVKLFRNGRSQAIRIPREFELPGTDATIRKEGGRLVIEAATAKPRRLAELPATLEPIDETFPEIENRFPEPFDL